MPRRETPDQLALAVGRRIRELRQERGLSIQALAERSGVGSKGHLSNVERGLVRPNVHTLKQLADGLGVLLLDLVTFPRRGGRQRLVELTRTLGAAKIAELIRLAARSGGAAGE